MNEHQTQIIIICYTNVAQVQLQQSPNFNADIWRHQEKKRMA